MKRLFTLLLFTTLSFSALSQLTSSDISELRIELLRLINQERNLKGLNSLAFDPKLKEAAEFHSDYMVKKQVLSHEQTSQSTKTPEDRVKKANGKEFEIVGENILYTVPQTFPLKKKAVLDLANTMFLQWKNSPPHYANILHSEYVLTDFGFSVDLKTNHVYATEVFGTKGIQVPGQLSENAFGIRKGDNSCEGLIQEYDGLITNLGNAIGVNNKDIILYYNDVEYITSFLTNQNDGIAVDLLLDSQMACGKPNELDFSPVYDGILLQPVYRDALFANNEAKGDYRFISKIGTIPEQYNTEELSVSLIIIKNGMACSYTYPVEIPSATYQLSDVQPILKEEANATFTRTGIIYSEEKEYDFKRNVVYSEKQQSYEKYPGSIYSVSIISYSSVEGSLKNNERLHNDRAQYILRKLHNERNFSDSVVHITAMENWPKMRFQLNYFDLESLSNQSNDSIKNYLRLNSSPFWDSLLYTQRKSTAIINIKGTLDSTADYRELLNLNLRTAIAEKNDQLANKALYELFQVDDPTIIGTLLEPFVFQALTTNPELVQNAAAVLAKETNYYLYPCAEFIDAWIYRLDELSPEAKHNLINLYTHLSVALIDEWDVPSQRLAKVIHPSKVYETANMLNNESLLLNFHLAAIDYFGQINDGPNISRSFNFIVKHFKKATLSEQERIDLALFFNNWTQYHSTIDLLYSGIDSPTFSEESAFILLATAFAYQSTLTDDQRLQIQERAYTFNPDLWCEFIRKNKQLKRITFVKNAFCSRCN
ncbi:MAG: CAP domain-containing protein [Fluviicola sp.]|nr:CAP domain-containing protein [Fluviicola sp.]